MLISEQIYKLLSEKGISQKEFSERTGISQSTISDWRRKGTNPSADKILIICDVLGVSPYELLSNSENRKYKISDYYVIDRKSKEYSLIECYQSLNSDLKVRLEGYLEALKDMKEHV